MCKWYNPYAVCGQWYKGNTHLHTFHGPNNSIRTDVETIVGWYRSRGYHFLNISDHNYITKFDKQYEDFIVFAGHESDCIVGIDVNSRAELSDADNLDTRLKRLQFWVDDIVSRGGIAQIAHPKSTLVDWRKNISYLKALEGISLIELYNHRTGDYGGEIDWRRRDKYAVEIWDELLLSGKWIWPSAVDDSHDYLLKPRFHKEKPNERVWEIIEDENEQFFESGGGWVCVLAEHLTPYHLKLNLRRGAVYASQGPAFEFIGIHNEKLIVKTKIIYTIRLILDGKILAEYQTPELNIDMLQCQGHKYLRVELIDEIGKRAWSAPFMVIKEDMSNEAED